MIHDLRCPDPDKMYFPNLAARAKFLKQTEEGNHKMEGVFDKIRREAAAEANAARKAAEKAAKEAEAKAAEAIKQAEQAAKQAKEEKESIAMRFLKLGKMSLEEIAVCCDLSVARVHQLAQSLA